MKPLPNPYFESQHVTLYLSDARTIDAKADMIFTDPPYGHEQNGGRDLASNLQAALGRERKTLSRPIANDGFNAANDLAEWLFQASLSILPAGGCLCCCCSGGGGRSPQYARWSLMIDNHLHFKQMVVWDKGPMGLGWHYRRSYELVLVGQKPGRCKWYDSTRKVENIVRNIPKIIPRKTDHPTPKPVALAEHFIRLHTLPGETVFDPFAGGGSTLVAAVQSGRKAIGVELDERWAEIAAKRLEKATVLSEPATVTDEVSYASPA